MPAAGGRGGRRLIPMLGTVGRGPGPGRGGPAGQFADKLSGSVIDADGEWTRGGGLQIVIQDGAIRRVGAGGYLGRKRRVEVSVVAHAHGSLRAEEIAV